jgi:hypothetical protein
LRDSQVGVSVREALKTILVPAVGSFGSIFFEPVEEAIENLAELETVSPIDAF